MALNAAQDDNALTDEKIIEQRFAKLEIHWIEGTDQTKLQGTKNTSDRLDEVAALLNDMGVDEVKLFCPDRHYVIKRSAYGQKLLNFTNSAPNAQSDFGEEEEDGRGVYPTALDRVSMKRLPVDLAEACKNWELALRAYHKGFEPPLRTSATITLRSLEKDMRTVVVYYTASEPIGKIIMYMSRREMAIHGLESYTCKQILHDDFGYTQSYYHSMFSDDDFVPGYSDLSNVVVPMCGTFVRTEVIVNSKTVPVAVYNMIAPDLSESHCRCTTADFYAITQIGMDLGIFKTPCEYVSATDDDKYLFLLALRHALMIYLAFVAARDHGFTKIADVNVGGLNCIPKKFWPRFDREVHRAALYYLGYGSKAFEEEFPGIRLVPPPPDVPLSLLRREFDDVLHVNACSHSALIGNGNVQNPSLDGAWGRIGNLAPLAWPYTNPYIRFRPVNTNDFEGELFDNHKKPSTDPLCGASIQELIACRDSGSGSGGGSSSALPKKRIRAV